MRSITKGNAPVSIRQRAPHELFFRIVAEGEMKTEILGDAVHVDFAHGQSPFRRRIDDSQESQSTDGLAQTNAADSKKFGQFDLSGQPVSRFQIVVDNILLNVLDADFVNGQPLD